MWHGRLAHACGIKRLRSSAMRIFNMFACHGDTAFVALLFRSSPYFQFIIHHLSFILSTEVLSIKFGEFS
jgi:hypothetical protein